MDDLNRLFHPAIFGDAPSVRGTASLSREHAFAVVQMSLFQRGTELSFELAADNAPLTEVLKRFATSDRPVQMRVGNNTRFTLPIDQILDRVATRDDVVQNVRFMSQDAGFEWVPSVFGDEPREDNAGTVSVRRFDAPTSREVRCDVHRVLAELFPPYDRAATDGLYNKLTERVSATYDAPTPHLYLV